MKFLIKREELLERLRQLEKSPFLSSFAFQVVSCIKDFPDVRSVNLFFQDGFTSLKDEIEKQLLKAGYQTLINKKADLGLSLYLLNDRKENLSSLEESKYLISLGLNPFISSESGIKKGEALKEADLTLSLDQSLCSLFLNDGLDSSKEERILITGLKSEKTLISLNEKKDLKGLILPRKRNSNKGDYRRSFVIGGSRAYLGAPLLSYSSLAALEMGSGFSYLSIPEETYDLYALKEPQTILFPFPSKGGRMVYKEAFLKDVISKADAIVFGMGIGVSEEVYASLKYLLSHFEGKLIIDADGLNCLAEYGLEALKEKRCQLLLTPHLGEFARLCKKSILEVQNAPLTLGQDFASFYQVTLILKSASSIILDGKRIKISSFGNAGLAKAGSGDLLDGLLVGLASHPYLDLAECADLGTYLLGRSAELATEKISEESLTYADICQNVRFALKEIGEQ
jgi:hydroxyethylthiazole kinase-like uncharacterized protein yjeF